MLNIKPRHQFRQILVLLFLLSMTNSFAGNYTVNAGERINLYCTASAPAGYITHVFYNLVDNADIDYIAIDSYPSDMYAVVHGLKAKKAIKVEVTYAYSYLGTYDNKIHVGHGTYYDYITVVGGVEPTSIDVPETIDMSVGQTIEVSASLQPADATTVFTWGAIMGYGNPYNFDISYRSSKAQVTANGIGSMYLAVQTANGKSAVCLIKATENSPSRISIPTSLDGYVGESLEIFPSFYPEGTSSKLTWHVSDEGIASINNNKLIFYNDGEVELSCSANNGVISNACKVKVSYKEPEDITINTHSETMMVGEELAFTCAVLPEYAKRDLEWQVTGDKDVLSITPEGTVTAIKPGRSQIKVTSYNGMIDVCDISVKPAPTNITIPETLSMVIDQLVEPEVSLSPHDAYSKYKITSSNTRVIEVIGNKLHALREGVSTITIETLNGLSVTTEITVNKVSSVYLVFNNDTASMVNLSAKPYMYFDEEKIYINYNNTTYWIDPVELEYISFTDKEYKFSLNDFYGDVNNDGRIAISDLNFLIHKLIDNDDIIPETDINGDGEINNDDINELVNKILNK